jgi:hypothetical protein
MRLVFVKRLTSQLAKSAQTVEGLLAPNNGSALIFAPSLTSTYR